MITLTIVFIVSLLIIAFTIAQSVCLVMILSRQNQLMQGLYEIEQELDEIREAMAKIQFHTRF